MNINDYRFDWIVIYCYVVRGDPDPLFPEVYRLSGLCFPHVDPDPHQNKMDPQFSELNGPKYTKAFLRTCAV